MVHNYNGIFFLHLYKGELKENLFEPLYFDWNSI